MKALRPIGETGRRERLKIFWRNPWKFDSSIGYDEQANGANGSLRLSKIGSIPIVRDLLTSLSAHLFFGRLFWGAYLGCALLFLVNLFHVKLNNHFKSWLTVDQDQERDARAKQRSLN